MFNPLCGNPLFFPVFHREIIVRTRWVITYNADNGYTFLYVLHIGIYHDLWIFKQASCSRFPWVIAFSEIC